MVAGRERELALKRWFRFEYACFRPVCIYIQSLPLSIVPASFVFTRRPVKPYPDRLLCNTFPTGSEKINGTGAGSWRKSGGEAPFLKENHLPSCSENTWNNVKWSASTARELVEASREVFEVKVYAFLELVRFRGRWDMRFFFLIPTI